ncbi:permease-like cell division protein FtsX [Orbaceae bacterium ESL0721]|nr:permease-like cell division protein FtsX [Orbaceae bacterium ESL0721]
MFNLKYNNKNRKHNKNEHRFFSRWLRQISYAWKNVWHDFLQHRIASILTIMVIAISITLPTIGYLLWKNVNIAANLWSPTPNLTVYLNKNLTDAEIKQLLTTFNAYSEVEKINYLSRSEALEEFKTWSGFGTALDLLDDNPLPSVAIIIPNELAKQTDILHELQAQLIKIDGVDDAKLDDSWFTRLTALTNMVKTLVWTISLFMLVAVSLVIGNSIRLTIFSRRQTIKVMQLIGATDGFILRPFLYHGIFISFISVILALILSEIFIIQIESIIWNVSAVFGTIFVIEGLSWDECLLILFFVTIIGWLAALITTKRYLKVTQIT